MAPTPRYFVKRTRRENWEKMKPEALRAAGYPWKCAGYVSWTGPLPAKRAYPEARAWDEEGWDTEVVLSTPEVRAEVKAFERQKKAEGR